MKKTNAPTFKDGTPDVGLAGLARLLVKKTTDVPFVPTCSHAEKPTVLICKSCGTKKQLTDTCDVCGALLSRIEERASSQQDADVVTRATRCQRVLIKKPRH
jgi:methionyl-tRNA synthetase